jgi:glycine cleavage system aminomethyltransferase T
MRERVAMIDLSAFSKFDVTGHGALEYMQRMTVAQMDVPVSRLVYTPILNQMGGVVADLTVARIGHNHFRVIAGGASGNMDKTWFQSHLPQDESVKFADVTEEYSVLGVWGPSARELLQSISDDDVTNAAFPFSTVKQITIGDASVWAVRISYVGELGWELYIPVGQSLGVWDLIWAKRKAFGLVPAGLGVYLSTARLEKGYRLQGSDLETEYDSYESGVARPKVKPQDFVGREAYLATRKIEPAATLCTMTVDCNQSSIGINRYMSGGEPLLTMDGGPIVDAKGRRSYVTSAADGPSIGKYMLMGYLPPLYAVPETSLQVEYFAERYPVTVKAVGNSPLYDPKNAKLRK